MAAKSSQGPKQERSRATEQRLLDAGEKLIQQRGFSGFSVADLVKEAGSSVGSFYARFGDKDGLLRALHKRGMAPILDKVNALESSDLIQQMELSDMAGFLMTELVRHYHEKAALMAAYNSRSALDPLAWHDVIESQQRLVTRLASALSGAKNGPSGGYDCKALELNLHMVFSVLGNLVVYGQIPQFSFPFNKDELPEQLSKILIASMGTQS